MLCIIGDNIFGQWIPATWKRWWTKKTKKTKKKKRIEKEGADLFKVFAEGFMDTFLSVNLCFFKPFFTN